MIGFFINIAYAACSTFTGQCEIVTLHAPVYAPISVYSQQWCETSGVFFAEADLRKMPLPHGRDGTPIWQVAAGGVWCTIVGLGE